MARLIKKSGSFILRMIVIACLALQPFCSLSVLADESKVYELPISYFNEYSSVCCDDNDEIKKHSNIILTTSTDKIQKDTVITISGIPEDCIYFQEDDKYTVVISEGKSKSSTYGGWYDGLEYEDGIIVYTVQEDEPYISLSFGDWNTKYASGRDAFFIINSNGKIEEK